MKKQLKRYLHKIIKKTKLLGFTLIEYVTILILNQIE